MAYVVFYEMRIRKTPSDELDCVGFISCQCLPLLSDSIYANRSGILHSAYIASRLIIGDEDYAAFA